MKAAMRVARLSRVAAVIGITLSLVLPAAAQIATSSARPTPGDAATALSSGTFIDSKVLDSVLGLEVRTASEENMGRIVDLLANPNGGVEAAVVELGGFLGIGTRKIAIEWPAVRFVNDGKRPIAVLDLSRDQLRTAPEYKPAKPARVLRAVQSPPPLQDE
jgi:hypothetical protein